MCYASVPLWHCPKCEAPVIMLQIWRYINMYLFIIISISIIIITRIFIIIN